MQRLLPSLTCSMCTVTIKKALQKVEGVQAVTVDYDSKTANITFDGQKIDTGALIKATTDVGYPGSLVAFFAR